MLDVGCGAGAASLALVPPAGSVVGVDVSTAMLDAFAAGCRARGVPTRRCWGSGRGGGSVDVADVVVCHHVAYSVRDVVAFVVELTGRARHRVVVELGAVHPSVALAPMWRHFWKLDRPRGPTAGDFLAVLTEAGIEPVGGPGARAAPLRSTADAVDVARRRLCLPEERRDEVARALAGAPALAQRTCGRSPGPATRERAPRALDSGRGCVSPVRRSTPEHAQAPASASSASSGAWTPGRRRHDGAGRGRAAVEAGDERARLPGDQLAGGEVPRPPSPRS